MIRKLKALGVAGVAVFAMSAFAASASANNITSLSYPQTVFTEDVGAADTTTIAQASISCEGEQYDATLTGPSTTIEFTPTYGNTCQTVPSGWNVTKTHNGCNLVLHWHEHVATDWDRVGVTVVCPTGKQIEIHHYSSSSHNPSSCTNTVGSQTAAGTLNLTSETASNDMVLHGTVHVANQTHGACSFGFTINDTAIWHFSTTVKTASGARIHMG